MLRLSSHAGSSFTGKVIMVITKDHSHFGKDMPGSNCYAERFFPEDAFIVCIKIGEN